MATKTGDLPLSQQLYEAYQASLRQRMKEDELAVATGNNCNREDNSNNDNNNDKVVIPIGTGLERSSPHTLSEKPPVRNKPLYYKKEEGKQKRVSSLYQLNCCSLEAWNHIGDLANDIGHSVIVRQAEIVNDLARKDNRIQEDFSDHCTEKEELPTRHTKRKYDDMVNIVDYARQEESNSAVVSSSSEKEDDSSHTGSGDEETIGGCSSMSSNSADVDRVFPQNDSAALDLQIERMMRMTTYIAEMDRIHRLFRLEMEGLAEFSGNFLSEYQ
ncbi:hypothetical protein IV203_009886 [Nitzschia inconspicua]|uniref:Uncharacterized protein n=1 Tax=Nitzschia inconspicua TaxID=303405 RepID=A0A9K3KVY4_9STRA|nr:hypothetical protein IV203_009886 [Nitzschia inconspicua]